MNYSSKIAASLLVFLSGFSTVNAQFGPLERISPIAVGVESSMSGDVDGDGDMDVVASSRIDGHITCFKNDGYGNFNDFQVILQVEADAHRIAIGDMNNDGQLDIVVGRGLYGSSPNKLFINQGDLTFIEVILTTPASQFESTPVIIDFDNNGLLDIVVTRDGYWYKNVGDGQFEGPSDLPGNGTLQLVGDVNADGLPDLFTGFGNETQLHLNDGAGSSFNMTPVGFAQLDEIIDLGDMDADGDMDLVIRRAQPGIASRFAWLENDGQAVFTSVHNMTNFQESSMYGGAIMNLDQTPEPELLCNGFIFHPDSADNVNPPVLFEHGWSYASKLYFSDFNSDGNLDVLFDRGPSIIFGNGTFEGWNEAIFLNNLNQVQDFELVDMDRDGDEDIVANSLFDANLIQVLPYLGNGVYARRAEQVSFGAPMQANLLIKDFNLDGFQDIGLYSWYNREFNCAMNMGDGVYSLQSLLFEDSIAEAYEAAFEDFDGDGDLDILHVPYQYDHDDIQLFRNTDGIFTPEFVGLAYDGISALIEAVDMEGDGDMDVVVSMRGDFTSGVNSGVLLLLNNGNGGFSNQFYPHGPEWYDQEMSIADLDLDGDQDIVITNGDGVNNMVMVFEYENEGLLMSVIDQENDLRPFVSHITDVDNDGWKDILCFTFSVVDDIPSGIFWYKNIGGLQFEPPYFQVYTDEQVTELPYTGFVYNPYDIESLDRDLDGDEDLFLSEQGGSMNCGSIYYIENLFWGSYRITGDLFVDTDTSGTHGPSDLPFPFISVTVDPTSSAFYSNAAGVYNAITGMGTYTISPSFDTDLWTLSSPFSSYTVTMDSSNTLVTDRDFGVIPNGVQPNGDLEVIELVGACNIEGVMWVSLQNTGNTILSGTIVLEMSPLIDPQSIESEADSIVDNRVYFSVDSLYFYDLEQWVISVDMPSEQFIGQPMVSSAVYYDNSGFERADTAIVNLSCAYDPNDKYETTGIGPEGMIENGQWLEYTIRFQNTGNAPATQVVIRDGLSQHVDRSTLTPISWSHDMELSVEPDGEAVFKFEEIMLPDSGSDYAGSQGFVRYRIKADSTLLPGTRILNQARIIFDFNPPVMTNTTSNMVLCFDPEEQLIVLDSIILQSPFSNPLSQQWFFEEDMIAGATTGSFQPAQNGIYHVEAIYPVDCKVSSEPFLFVATGIMGEESLSAVIYPNPNNGNFVVQLSGAVENEAVLLVTDAVGRTVIQQEQLVSALTTVDATGLSEGLFLVFIESKGARSFLGKVVVTRD